MATDKELAEHRLHEETILARLGISSDLAKRSVTMREFSVATHDLIAAIGRLSDRLAKIESADKYKGVFQRALGYPAGSLVTHGGSLWTALADVPKGIVPGMNADLWQLASKGGKPPATRAKP